MRTGAILLAAAAILIALAGCGDDNGSGGSLSGDTTATSTGPTKTISRREGRQIRRKRARTERKVKQICRRVDVDMTADAQALKAQKSARAVGRLAKQLQTDYENAAKELARIGSASKSRLDVGTGVKQASTALEDGGKTLELMQAAAQTGDLATALKPVKRLEKNALRYQATIKRYDFTACG